MPIPEYKKRQNEARLARKAEEAERKLAVRADEDDPAALRPGWYDKRSVAAYFAVSVSYIEKRMQEGMPHALLGNRVRFKPADCEAWLVEHGHLERKGGA